VYNAPVLPSAWHLNCKVTYDIQLFTTGADLINDEVSVAHVFEEPLCEPLQIRSNLIRVLS
jgi:hypothetical protein